ncbi:hypothetical protein MMC17_008643 [Xylographa soralifera]|nr:hypothetical protein [Xylographa soralifera]
MGRSSTDSEKSSFADTENLLDHEQPQANDQPGRNRTRFLFAFNCIFAILNFTLLVSLISNLVPWSGKAVQLPSHEWSKEATKIELRPFDDVFHDHYSVYRGEPRPELDHAWMKLLRGYTVRIPAPGWYGPSRPNGTIVELLDGSGDTLATPAVLHQLHCLVCLVQE